MSNRFCWFEIFGLSVGLLHRSQEEKKRERSEREKERKFWIQRKKKIQEVNTVMTLNARTKWPLEVSWLQIEEDTGRQIKREKERRKRTEISCVCVCHCVCVCVFVCVAGARQLLLVSVSRIFSAVPLLSPLFRSSKLIFPWKIRRRRWYNHDHLSDDATVRLLPEVPPVFIATIWLWLGREDTHVGHHTYL